MTRFGLALVALAVAAPALAQQTPPLLLDGHWQLQSSAAVASPGEAMSRADFDAAAWYPASVPSTVVGTLVADKVYPDPYVGMNLRSIPGTSYPIGNIFTRLPMPADSPFHAGWWYRTTFTVPTTMRGQRLALHIDGVNYRADIWLNGQRIATSTDVVGTYRLYEFDIIDRVRVGEASALAVEVFPPEPDDLAWTWVDWNPMPPDKNMGLWRRVFITASGDVAVRHALVASHVAADLRTADLTVTAELQNLTGRAVHAVLHGALGSRLFDRPVDLAAHETRTVTVTADEAAALHLSHPSVWWPYQMGTPALTTMTLEAVVDGAVSDREDVRFGIREITSTVTNNARQFFVNGKPILIRGGGWAPDMLLRPNVERQDAELAYVRDLGLNTIRLEGKLEDDRFFDEADRLGILVLAGWCCCDQWEQWAKWKPENKTIAEASERDQVRRLRTHPSLLAWLNGSDNPPPADIEQMYIDVLKAERWPNPYVSSASAKATSVTGPSGVKMTGPYDWVPPSYWLTDTKNGGAFGFNTETSPGAAVPPIESIKAMIPADHLWPIDEVWNYHAGGGQFKTLDSFTKALSARYGDAASADDYAMKSQLMTYEGERAMFEAYRRNAPAATGVIQWMLNNAWPGMIWHLYDYYLRPGGGYFGAKKANEPVHALYAYDDRSVWVVNDSGTAADHASVSARVLAMDGRELFSDWQAIAVAAGDRKKIMTVPVPAGASPTYFVELRLTGHAPNFYWLGTKMDVLDFARSTWYTTPVTSYADFTALKDLPKTTVSASMQEAVPRDDMGRPRPTTERRFAVTIRNTGATIAFFVRLQALRGPGGAEILPVRWDDNDISVLPRESRTVTATFDANTIAGATPTLVVSGWNLK